MRIKHQLLKVCLVFALKILVHGQHRSDHVVFYTPESPTPHARLLAQQYGLRYVSEVFSGSNYHHAVIVKDPSSFDRLKNDPKVHWIERQMYQPRALRFIDPNGVTQHELNLRNNAAQHPWFNDPFYPQQWYLHGEGHSHHHLNVVPVWQQNLTGRGISIAVLDDNVDPLNPDLAQNYDPRISVDLGADEHGPEVKKNPIHGTYCAAVIAAEANNSYCGVGVAYQARVGGVRLLVKKRVLDINEARALNHRLDYVDIYTASWGPPDDGRHIGGPGRFASHALKRGITLGRNGLGAIYVWASGNGGLNGDHCSYDAYASSPYTLTVSALTSEGLSPYYAEACPAALTSLYVGGQHGFSLDEPTHPHNVVVPKKGNGCHSNFQGTSAAAPLAAGIIALLLEANPKLTWRDVHHLVVLSSSPPYGITSKHPEVQWKTNGAGHRSNDRYGFGALNASTLIRKGRKWKIVPRRRVVVAGCPSLPKKLTSNEPTDFVLTIESGTVIQAEYVSVTLLNVDVQPHRGILEVSLQSPSGMVSKLLEPRWKDHNRNGFHRWTLTSAQFWGENPSGLWTLSFTIHRRTGEMSDAAALLHSCYLTVSGF